MILKIVSCEEITGGDIMAKDYNKLKMQNDRIKKTLIDCRKHQKM